MAVANSNALLTVVLLFSAVTGSFTTAAAANRSTTHAASIPESLSPRSLPDTPLLLVDHAKRDCRSTTDRCRSQFSPCERKDQECCMYLSCVIPNRCISSAGVDRYNEICLVGDTCKECQASFLNEKLHCPDANDCCSFVDCIQGESCATDNVVQAFETLGGCGSNPKPTRVPTLPPTPVPQTFEPVPTIGFTDIPIQTPPMDPTESAPVPSPAPTITDTEPPQIPVPTETAKIEETESVPVPSPAATITDTEPPQTPAPTETAKIEETESVPVPSPAPTMADTEPPQTPVPTETPEVDATEPPQTPVPTETPEVEATESASARSPEDSAASPSFSDQPSPTQSIEARETTSSPEETEATSSSEGPSSTPTASESQEPMETLEVAPQTTSVSEPPAQDDCVAVALTFQNQTSLAEHMGIHLDGFRLQSRVREGIVLCLSLANQVDGGTKEVCATANHLFMLHGRYLSLQDLCAVDGQNCFTQRAEYRGIKWDTKVAGYLYLDDGLYLTPHSTNSGRLMNTVLEGHANWLLRLLTQ